MIAASRAGRAGEEIAARRRQGRGRDSWLYAPSPWSAVLPPLWLAVAAALATVPVVWRWPRSRLACALVLGFCLALAGAHERRHPVLAPHLAGTDLAGTDLTGTDLTLEGRVAGLVQTNDRRERFRFVVAHGWRGGERLVLPDTVRLAWYHQGEPRGGAGVG